MKCTPRCWYFLFFHSGEQVPPFTFLLDAFEFFSCTSIPPGNFYRHRTKPKGPFSSCFIFINEDTAIDYMVDRLFDRLFSNRYSHGVLSFSLAACILELDLNVMPIFFDFPTELSVIPLVDIIEMPPGSMSTRFLGVDLACQSPLIDCTPVDRYRRCTSVYR